MRNRAQLVATLCVLVGLAAPVYADELDPSYDSEPAAEVLLEAAKAPSGTLASVREVGTATWYGPGFEGRKTASGERFSARALTAAHKSLPFGTRVRVTVLDSLASVVVVINDRLPSASRHVIDLSRAAGSMLDMIAAGIARVRVEILD